ncbi:MAG: hypothetical protein WD066_08455 [Planctomycetaceae bacterium]
MPAQQTTAQFEAAPDTSSEQPSDAAAATRVDLGHELTRGFTAKMIRQKAKQLIGHFGFTKSDRNDLEQELKLAVLERADQFDPAVANWDAFVTMIVDHAIVTLIVERWAEKREFRHEVASLSTLVPDPDGEMVEISTQIGEQHLERVTETSWPHHAEEYHLEHDLEVALSRMPPDLRDLCERLKREPVIDIARDLAMSRTKLYRTLEWIREFFEASDFFGPLAEIPDISPSESVDKQ